MSTLFTPADFDEVPTASFIHDYCHAVGVEPSTFGAAVLNDAQFVDRLSRGRVSVKNAALALEFIRSHPDPAKREFVRLGRLFREALAKRHAGRSDVAVNDSDRRGSSVPRARQKGAAA